jgi:hypothetical protein
LTTIPIDAADTRAGLSASTLVAALPPLALACLTVVMLILGALGRHPMWHVPELNLSEAAGARDAASVVLLISRGEDPDLARPVRAGVIDPRHYEAMTPIEAALDARRAEIIDLLLRHGAVLDEAHRVEYACKAKARGDGDIVQYFEARGGPVSCPSQERRE